MEDGKESGGGIKVSEGWWYDDSSLGSYPWVTLFFVQLYKTAVGESKFKRFCEWVKDGDPSWAPTHE